MILFTNPKQPQPNGIQRFTQKKQVVSRPIPKYKLVVYFKDGCSYNPTNKPRVFYSYPAYDKKGDIGKTRLIHLVTAKYQGMYITALLYNNRSGVLIEKWVGSLVKS